MDLENPLASPGLMPYVPNYLDDIPDANTEQSLLNISNIKHEPLDLSDNDSSDESAEVSSQVADRSINERAVEIKENGYPPIESLFNPEYTSEDILNNANGTPFEIEDSIQNLNANSQKNGENISNIHIISNVLVNGNIESVLDNLEGTHVDQNSSEADPLENLVEDSLLLEDNTYSCSLCSFTTDRQLRLSDHERYHRKTNVPIFQCAYCNQRYTRNLLFRHIQNVHPGQKFQICDEEANETPYKCSMCPFSSRLPVYLKFHMKKHRPKISKGTENSSQLETIKKSLNIVPEKSSEPTTALNCSFCSFVASEEAVLKLHIKTHLKTTKVTDPTGKPCWYCSVCSYSSCNVHHMKGHLKCHLNNNPLKKCPRCDYRSTPRMFINHEKLCFKETVPISSNESSGSKSSKIKRLVKSSKDKITFKSSLKYKSYSVSRTDKLKLKFLSGTLVNKAEMIIDSNGDQTYKCKMCSYTQSKQVAMVNHIRAHKYGSLLKCKNCDFKSTSAAVKFHQQKCKERSKLNSMKTCTVEINPQKKHLNEPEVLTDSSGHRIYQCKMCSYSQKKFVAMVAHIATHKFLSIENCSNCDFKSTPRAVKFHQKNCKKRLKRTDDARKNQEFNKYPDKDSENDEVSSKILHKCSSCSFITSNDITFKIHVKKHLYEPDITTSSGYKLQQCKMCSYNSRDIVAITSHINSHKKNVSIVNCPNCDFKSTQRIVTFHLRNCKETFKSVTEKNASDSNEIDQNSVGSSQNTRVLSSTLLKCNTCSFSSSDDLELKVHKKKHFFEPEISTDSCGYKIYKCRMCSHSHKNFAFMVAHINSHKNVLYNVKCVNCDFQSTPLTVKEHSRMCKESLQTTRRIQDNTSKVDNVQDLVKIPESDKVPLTKHFRCSSCSFSTTDELKLKLHKKKHSEEPDILTDSFGQKTYCCKKCSYVCNKIQQIFGHINTHKTSLSIVKCPYCDFKSTPRTVKFHLRKCKERLLPKGVKTITEVTKSTRTKSSIMPAGNRNRNTDDLVIRKRHQCYMCSYTTPQLARMRSHINTHKRNFPVIKCSKCDYRSTARPLKLHMKKIHFSTKMSFSCEHCSFVTLTTVDFTRHMKGHEPANSTNISGEQKLFKDSEATTEFSAKIYRCKLCSFITSKPQSFSSHMRVHSPKEKGNNMSINSPLVTDDEESYTTNQHQQTKDVPRKRKYISTKIYKCRLCSLVTSQGSAYASHMTSHDQKLPIKKCPGCNFKSTPSCLMKHMNIKGHNRKFKCLVCSLICRNRQNLDSHMRSHVSKKPMKKCTYCSFRSTVCALRAHMQKCRDVADEDSSKITKDISDDSNDAEENVSCKRNGKALEINKIPKPSTERSLIQCSQCSFSTYLRIKLKFHKKKYHLEQNKTEENNVGSKESNANSIDVNSNGFFNCGDCAYVTKSNFNYFRHLQSHLHPKKRTFIACKKCGYQSTRYDVKLHSQTCKDTKKPELKCTFCFYSSDQKETLKNHMEDCHFDELKFQNTFEAIECTICDYVTLFRRKFNEHEENQHGSSDVPKSNKPMNDEESGDKTVHKCPSCAFSSIHKGNLKRHIDMNHVEKKTRSRRKRSKSENLSDEESSIGMILKPHKTKSILKQSKNESMKLSSGKNQESSGIVSHEHQNNIYDKESEEESSLKQSNVKNTKNVSKVQQKNSFETVESAQREAIILDKEDILMSTPGTYACSLCSYTTTENATLYNHLQLHRKNVPVRPCPNENCSYKSTPKALSLHFLECSELIEPEMESSSANYEPEDLKQCPYCDFEGSLAVWKRHKTICPYKGDQKELLSCSQCSYSTYLPKNLTEHGDTIHAKKEVPKYTSPKSFQCKYCSFASFLEYVFERHMNSHTLMNLPIKQCSRCDFRSTPSALAAHVNSCTKKSKHLSDASANEPPTKKVKRSKRAVANGLKTGSDGEQPREDNEKAKKELCEEVAEVYQVTLSDYDSENSELQSNQEVMSNHSESSESQSNKEVRFDDYKSSESQDYESSESQSNPEGISVANHFTLVHVNNHIANDDVVNESEAASISSSSATGNSPKNIFHCAKCPFSCKLRIVLKVHIDKNH